MADFICRYYPEQQYHAIFDKDSGFFVRLEEEGAPEPSWAENGPELLDISLTGHCSRGCTFCYRDSSVGKSEIHLGEYESVLRQAAELGVFQIALGGGNPNEHSRFLDILRMTRETYGIIPTYSTNGQGITREILNATQRYCGAVAVSYYGPDGDFRLAIKEFTQAGIATNIHFVVTKDSIDEAIVWLQEGSELMCDINAIVFLSYKPVGRGKRSLLVADPVKWDSFFQAVAKSSIPKVGFDSCFAAGVSEGLNTDWRFYDTCEAARFSAFISEHLLMYPCSFMETTTEGTDLHSNTLIEAWRHAPSFVGLRSSDPGSPCNSCRNLPSCKGGCKVFPEINACHRYLSGS